MAQNVSFFCPHGGDWYTCLYGTRFAGCCSVDPCTEGCPQNDLHPFAFQYEQYERVPDLSCFEGAYFYKCSGGDVTFVGCCKEVPCNSDSPNCPKGSLVQAYMDRPEQIDFYGKPDINNYGQPAVTTSPIVYASAVPTTVRTQVLQVHTVSDANALISFSVSIAIAVISSIALMVWLCYRKVAGSSLKQWSSLGSIPSTTEVVSNSKSKTQIHCSDAQTIPTTQDLSRLGTRSLCILAATTLVEFLMCGFLSFLWFAKPENKTWKLIMINGWATRSVAVVALILRTAVDFQAAIGTAILASLFLESQSGVHMYQIAGLSPMRAGASTPWDFAWCAVNDAWKSTALRRQHYSLYIASVLLIVTTTALQFSSTALLSDLKLGPLAAHQFTSEIRPGPSYAYETEKIPRDSAWTTNPPSFPSFGEYHEPAPLEQGDVADTGMLLRAFLPYEAPKSRQTLSSYSGNALILDARVSCQAPDITQLYAADDLNTQITGLAGPSKQTPMLQNIKPAPFDCTLAGDKELTICQISKSPDSFIGSLKSQFTNSTAFGTAFLVLSGSRDPPSPKIWLPLSMDQSNSTLKASATLCFAPWDSAVLDVTLSGDKNRSEPLLQHVRSQQSGSRAWTGFQTRSILNQLIPTVKNGTRQILQMKRPHSFTGDLPPRYRRPVVQSDIGSSSAAETSSPLPGNWTVALNGTPLVSLLRWFRIRPTQLVAADPALAAIFHDAVESTSIEWALSSLITILSMTNYYGQQPAFDRLDNVTMSFFEDVLYPRDFLGLTLLMWVLTAHIAVIAALVVLFVQRTRLTLLGNAWSAFAQIAGSGEIMEHVAGASTRSDAEVLDDLKDADRSKLRARVVRRGEGAEVVVE